MKKDILYINSVEDIRLVDMLRVLKKHDYSKDYLTFKALEDCLFSFTVANGIDDEDLTQSAYVKAFYSFDEKNWVEWTTTQYKSVPISVSANENLYVKAITGRINISAYGIYGTIWFNSTGNFNVGGPLDSLLYNDDGITKREMSDDYYFSKLFQNCSGLVSAENLILPNYVKSLCYVNMFSGCTSLTIAPTLPATTLERSCYQGMFRGCTSLTITPELPATTLAENCYDSMFSDCTSLISASGLPATTLAKTCYTSMFKNCTSLTMAPKLHSTELTFGCYSGMFKGCTSLTVAPELPATTLASSCYASMFYDCTNLNYIKAMFTTTPSSTYTYNWVSGVASPGTFVKNSAATWDVKLGVDTIPPGWTVETADN